MPPKTKQQKQLASARAVKRRRSEGESSKADSDGQERGEGSLADQESLSMAGDSEEDDEIDFDFVEGIAEYASEWFESLNWDDLQSRSLSIFLWNMLLNVIEYQLLTDVAKSSFELLEGVIAQ
jgi:hypothetical protein